MAAALDWALETEAEAEAEVAIQAWVVVLFPTSSLAPMAVVAQEADSVVVVQISTLAQIG